MLKQKGYPVLYRLEVYLRHCPVLSYCHHLDHKVEEKLSNTLTLPSQHSLPIDRKLKPDGYRELSFTPGHYYVMTP